MIYELVIVKEYGMYGGIFVVHNNKSSIKK